MTNFYDRLQGLEFAWRDAIDILVVAAIIYFVLSLIRGTRAAQMAFGLLLLIAAYFGAQALGLVALETIAEQILFYLPFAIIVLFQHEIRRALTTVGRNSLVALIAPRPRIGFAEAVARAAEELARRRIGALIAVERTQSLRTYIEGGKPIDGIITAELLISIFTPNTPLHDGAVLVQNDRIAAAGIVLPLTSNQEIRRFGTRHRAALGLSEETDAVVVVVSEENGSIAVGFDGRLYEGLSREALEEFLHDPVGTAKKT